MKFDELIEQIKNGTFEPYMNLSIYFKEDLGTEKQEAIEELAKKQGSAEYEIDESLYIEDIDSFFFYERNLIRDLPKENTTDFLEKQFRKNIADFLVKINKISEIEAVNLCTAINLGD